MDAGLRDQGDDCGSSGGPGGHQDSALMLRHPDTAGYACTRLLALEHQHSYSGLAGHAGAGKLAAAMAAAAANAQALAAAATETTGTSNASKGEAPDEERVRRRREINRNSQKRIRERRNKELDGLRHEACKLHSDNELLLKQVESLTLEKADMLRQIQDLTEKWQQSIAENAWLNRENIQLRNSLQQLNTLVHSGAAPTAALISSAGASGSGSGGAVPELHERGVGLALGAVQLQA